MKLGECFELMSPYTGNPRIVDDIIQCATVKALEIPRVSVKGRSVTGVLSSLLSVPRR